MVGSNIDRLQPSEGHFIHCLLCCFNIPIVYTDLSLRIYFSCFVISTTLPETGISSLAVHSTAKCSKYKFSRFLGKSLLSRSEKKTTTVLKKAEMWPVFPD